MKPAPDARRSDDYLLGKMRGRVRDTAAADSAALTITIRLKALYDSGNVVIGLQFGKSGTHGRNRREAVPHAQVQSANAQEVSKPLSRPTQLATVIRNMTREIQRLHEDNRQLHAAINMYKELVRLHNQKMS